MTFIGDGNNVANSLILCGALLGVEIRIACPKGYEPNSLVINKAKEIYKNKNLLSILHDPHKAVSGANVIYTDVWASMGQKEEATEREKVFAPYQVNKDLINNTGKDTLFMHCLPAERGREVTDEVMESKNSIVFDQAENRMHAQNAIMVYLTNNLS